MLLKRKKFKNQRGFAIALALLMLVVMSLMGATLLVVVAGDHKRNSNQDVNQQAFYAAESGLSDARVWLSKETPLTPRGNPDNQSKFCKTDFFPNLTDAKVINDRVSRDNLDNKFSNMSQDEKNKLSNYSFEYFITYTPDKNGLTQNQQEVTVASDTGSSIAMDTSYKSQGGNSGTRFTIFSCGCNASYDECRENKSIIVRLMQNVVLK
mgnify:FL=1|tara:strand:+ start:1054 stop:1680 length:627 start_codon:yes stop_codon:yes gene_type:complete